VTAVRRGRRRPADRPDLRKPTGRRRRPPLARCTVAEVTPDRVVLENTRCPFGESVRRAPALCRMTSCVLGGIAARHHPDGASVLLEERIAVVDPGCRVVVHLGPPPPDVAPFAHHYAGPPASG
jgi:hypothetical protein